MNTSSHGSRLPAECDLTPASKEKCISVAPVRISGCISCRAHEFE